MSRPRRDVDAGGDALRVSVMTLAEVAAVGAMEQRNYDFPWNVRIFRDCVRSGYACLLAHQAERHVGYAIVQMAADEAHLLNLCIDRPWQHRGLARELLEWVIESVTRKQARTLYLEVRPSNPRAVRLYQRAGFNEIGTRAGYYDAVNGREDALVMALTLEARGG